MSGMGTKYRAVCPPGMYISGLVLDIVDRAEYSQYLVPQPLPLPPQSTGGIISIVCKSYIGGETLIIPTANYVPRGTKTQLIAPTSGNMSLVSSQMGFASREYYANIAFAYVFMPLDSTTPLVKIMGIPSPIGDDSQQISSLVAGVGVEFTVMSPKLPMMNIQVLTANVIELQAAALTACVLSPNSACDVAVKNYCSQARTQNDPVCGCVNSPAGNPVCNDVRCTKASYRLAGWIPVCPNSPVTCAEWSSLSNGKYLAPTAVPPTGGCGAPQSALPITNTVMIIFMIIIVVILIAIGMRREHSTLHTTTQHTTTQRTSDT